MAPYGTCCSRSTDHGALAVVLTSACQIFPCHFHFPVAIRTMRGAVPGAIRPVAAAGHQRNQTARQKIMTFHRRILLRLDFSGYFPPHRGIPLRAELNAGLWLTDSHRITIRPHSAVSNSFSTAPRMSPRDGAARIPLLGVDEVRPASPLPQQALPLRGKGDRVGRPNGSLQTDG